MAVEDIGARLVIDPGSAVADLTATTDAVKDLNKSLLELGATADATMAKVAKAGDTSVAASGEAAAASDAQADITVGSSAAMTAALAEHQKALKGVSDATKAAKADSVSFSDALESIASGPIGKFGLAASASLAGAAGEGIDLYVKYQKAMTQLVTQAGVSAKQLPGLMAGGIQIAQQTGLAFNDVANQLYRIASATSGLKETNKQMLALGKSAADVAVLFNVTPGAPTEQVARLFGSLTNAGRSGKLQQVGNTPAQMAALLNAAVGTGDIRGQDLIGALGRGVLQSGQAVGAKLPDILAWLDLSTRLGAQPSTSGTLIAHSLQQIATPSEQGTKAQMMMGIQQGQLQGILKNQGIGPAVQFLMSSMSKFNPLPYYPAFGTNAPGAASATAQLQAWGMNPTLMAAFQSGTMTAAQQTTLQQFMLTKMFGGARQEIPVLSIAENPQLYASIESQIKKQSNQKTYQRDLAAALGTPKQQIEIALRNLETYSMDLGRAVTPALITFLHGFVDFTKALAQNKGAIIAFTALLGTFALLGTAAYGISKFIKMFEGFKSALSSLGTISNKLFGTNFGGGAAATTPLQTALDRLTLATDRLAGLMAGNDAEGGGVVARGGMTNAQYAAATGKGTAESEEEESGSGGLMIGNALKSGLGKLLGGGMMALIGAQLYNAFLRGPLAKKIGISNASLIGDAGTGALAGSMFGPEGIVAGAAIGAIVGGGIKHPFKAGMTGYQKLLQLQREGFNVSAGELQKAQDRELVGMPIIPGSSIKRTNNPGINADLMFAAKEQERSSLMQSELAQLHTIGIYMGTGSTQYKDALGVYLSNAKRFGITNKTTAMTNPSLQNKANTAEFYATLLKQQAQKNLLYSAVSGGSEQQTKNAIKGTALQILQGKSAGASPLYINELKDQLNSEESHLKNIERLQAKLTKATDTEGQTKSLQETTKDVGDTTNGLLGQILTALNALRKQPGGLSTSPSGMVPGTSFRNLLGSGG